MRSPAKYCLLLLYLACGVADDANVGPLSLQEASKSHARRDEAQRKLTRRKNALWHVKSLRNRRVDNAQHIYPNDHSSDRIALCRL